MYILRFGIVTRTSRVVWSTLVRDTCLVAALLVGLAVAGACGGGSADDEVSSRDPNRGLMGGIGAPAVHRFEAGASDLEAWTPTGNLWSAEGGQVVGRRVHNNTLWRREPIPPNVRIEWEAKASKGGDIRVEVFGDGEHHESGYLLAYHAWGGAAHVLGRLDEHGADRVTAPVASPLDPDHTYKMAVVRTDASLRWFVDGELLLELVDERPLTGQGHDRFGLGGWSGEVRFDNVRIYTLPGEVGQ